MRRDRGGTLPRLTTGVPGLDRVLGGGIVEGASVVVIGDAGTGKTILASQTAFHHVAGGGRVLFVTVLTESHARLVGHLGTLAFFDASATPDRLYLVSGYPTLASEGVPGLLSMLQREIRERRVTLLVVDGLAVIETMASSPIEFQRFVHDLNGFLVATRCSALLLTTSEHSPRATELAVVDGIVQLTHELVGMRATRALRVVKLRGSAELGGRHMFKITSAGIEVFPRLEALLTHGAHPPPEIEARQPFGIRTLDEMLQGGLTAGSTTALLGAPGSGKTLLGLSFLVGGTAPALYFGMYEAPERLVAKAEGVGLRLRQRLEEGSLVIRWTVPVERLLDELGNELLDAVERLGARRVFIDGIDGFRLAAAYPGRITAFFTALTNELRARGVTTLFSEELELFSPDLEIPIDGISAMVENIIVLRYVEYQGRLRRLMSILKVRESGYDASLREFTIGAHGIDVAQTFESAERLLTGVAHAGSPPAARPRTKRGRDR